MSGMIERKQIQRVKFSANYEQLERSEYLVVSRQPMLHYNYLMRRAQSGGDFHKDPHLQVLVVIKGEALVETNGIQYRLQPGCVSVIPPKIEHAVYSMSGYEQVGLNMSLYDPSLMMGMAGIFHKHVRREMVVESKNILRIAKQVPPLLINRSELAAIRLHSLFLQIMTEIISGKIYGHGIRFDEKMSEMIEQRMSENLTSEQMAQEMHMSVSQMERMSNKFFGMGAMTYCKQLKLQRAQLLLIRSNMKIADIARETGFGSAANFSVFFSKNLNMTPSEYRRRGEVQDSEERGTDGMESTESSEEHLDEMK